MLRGDRSRAGLGVGVAVRGAAFEQRRDLGPEAREGAAADARVSMPRLISLIATCFWYSPSARKAR